MISVQHAAVNQRPLLDQVSCLEDCGTFGVLVLSVVSKTTKAMRLGQGSESRHCPVMKTGLTLFGATRCDNSCWRICLLARTQTIAAKQDVVIDSHNGVHQRVCKTLGKKSRVHLRYHGMLG